MKCTLRENQLKWTVGLNLTANSCRLSNFIQIMKPIGYATVSSVPKQIYMKNDINLSEMTSAKKRIFLSYF